MNLNKVTIAGNLTREPELKYLPKGTSICAIGIAVNRRWKNEVGEQKEEVTFVDCVAWAKTADLIAQYFRKGDPIYVEGRLTQESWDDKTSGQKRTKTKVTVESFQFVGGKKQEGDAPRREVPAAAPKKPKTEKTDDSDENLPF